jgi:hypothetical protein
MLYSNRNLTCEERQFDFGTIYQVKMGEEGRGRKLMALTVPKGTDIEKGMNQSLSMAYTKTGKPRIVKIEDPDLYLLISTDGGYTRRGNGYAKVLVSQAESFQVLANGNGADGAAGRIGSWECYFIKAPKNGTVLVQPSGGQDHYFLQMIESKVYRIECEQVCEAFEAFDIPIPFEYDPNHPSNINREEWVCL